MGVVMNNGPWRKYPRYRPAESEELKDFIVLELNPYYLKKTTNSSTPKYWPVLAIWHKGRFLDFHYNELKPVYYARLPRYPEE